MRASDALAILSDEQRGNKPVVFSVQRFALGRHNKGSIFFFCFSFLTSRSFVLARRLETTAVNHLKPTTLTNSAEMFLIFLWTQRWKNLGMASVLPLTPGSLIVPVLWILGWDGSSASCVYFLFLFLNLIISVLQELHAFSVADGLNSTYSK